MAKSKAPAPKKTAPKPAKAAPVKELHEEECTCGCEDDLEDECEEDDFEDMLFEMAEQAFLDLLYDRLKTRIEKRWGSELNEVADSFAEVYNRSRELAEMEDEEEELPAAKPAKAKKGAKK